MTKTAAPKEQTLTVAVSVLGIDANFEPATLAAYRHREKHIYSHIAAKGYSIDKCQGSMARRIYVAAKAQQPGVVYLTGVGHGSYTTYMGHYYDTNFEVAAIPVPRSAARLCIFCPVRRPETSARISWKTAASPTSGMTKILFSQRLARTSFLNATLKLTGRLPLG
jgi:hypothetical protein